MFLSSFSFVFLVSSCSLSCCHKCSPANMAHSSNHVRFISERSRSRDEPMWHHRQPQHRNQYRDAWHEVPPVPRLRKVLIIVDLDAVRPLMNKIHDDVMDSTTCDVLPSLSRNEELALFTYNVLVDTHQLESLTVYNLLYNISQHIWYTWDRYLSPSSMDLRWHKMKLETPSPFAMKTAWLNFFMNTVLIGLRAKNLASYFQVTFDISRLTISHTSCA